MKNILTSAILLLAASAASALDMPEKTPAFPGAEGFGRYTTGGRGGYVYHVTKLADDGAKGSLRWALAQTGPRTIVFDISGTIHLTSVLNITDNTTIAGQTAPGDGICVADYPIQVRGNNVIVRFMRMRLGNKNVAIGGADGWDGFGGIDGSDMMIDHCSISWSIDECCSFLGNHRTTVQWCLVAQSLVNSGHTKENHGYGGNWGGAGASFHHNMLIHHTSRTPRLGPRPTTQLDERMDMRNNVIYNWGGNGCYGGEGMDVNIVNNYYKPGPGTPSGTKGKRIASVGIRTTKYCQENPSYWPAWHIWGHYYVTGNTNTLYPSVDSDNWANGMYNQIDISSSATDGTWSEDVKKEIRLEEPIPFVYTLTHSSADAYAKVLDYVGASLVRDSFDQLMISDCENKQATYTGVDANGKSLGAGFVNSQDDNRPADAPNDWTPWPTLKSTQAPLDSDGDGMPDEWEIANGLNPNLAADGAKYCSDGYTNLEHYLNSLVAHITEGQAEGAVPEGQIITYDHLQESYTIEYATREGATNSFGNGITMSNDANGKYENRDPYIGIGRDQTHTITLPRLAHLWRVKIEGWSRYGGASYTEASLVEFAGQTFDEGVYTLPKDSKNPGEFTLDLTSPYPSDAVTMRWVGNNPWLRITLYVSDKADSGVENVLADTEHADTAWYTLQGIRLAAEPTAPGIYIHNGRKVMK